jgi:hypothetical protein
MTARPIRVAGVTEATAQYPWALLALAQVLRSDVVEPVTRIGLWDDPTPDPEVVRIPVRLVREPDNPVDANAVRVEVPVLDEVLGQHRHVGWVPADEAAVYAERLDAGAVPDAWVRSIPVGAPTDMRPGLVIFVDWPQPF